MNHSLVRISLFESCLCMAVGLAAASALVSCVLAAATGADSHAADASGSQATTVIPNDEHYVHQTWNFNAIHASAAWSYTTGSSRVLVAVIDSGKLAHPDLNAKWTGGYDFYNGDADPSDFGTYHHGVHVAGIIGAASNNTTGVTGLCWSCGLMPVLAADSGGSSPVNSPGYQDYLNHTYHVLANSIRYAAGLSVHDGAGHTVQAPKPADVINISLGNYNITCPAEVQAAVDDAVAAGSTVVAAAANGDDTGDYVADHYMWASCRNVIVVTAADAAGHRAAYASSGAGVTLAAPGGADRGGDAGWGALVVCTDPSEPRGEGTAGVFSSWSTASGAPCYRYWAGTSMATPHVSGVAALMKSRNASLSPAQIKAILTRTAQPIACPTAECGAGLVDAAAAVQAAVFSVAGSCTASGGSVRCSAAITGGVAPFSYQWQGLIHAAALPPAGAATAHGSCAPAGQPAWVQVQVTDALGRVSQSVATFTSH